VIGKISKGRSFSGILAYLFKLKERCIDPRAHEHQQEQTKEQELEWALNALENDERGQTGLEPAESGVGESIEKKIRERQPELLNNDRKRESRGKIVATNMAGRNPKELWREFAVQASLNPEVERYVFHCALGIPKEDNISPEQKIQIVEKFVRDAGFENTMWLAVEHDEHAHKEIHFVASLIDFDGKTIPDSMDYKRVEVIMRSTEKKFGLREVEPSHEAMRRSPTQQEVKYFERTGVLSTRMRLQAHIDEAIAFGVTITELIERLDARNINAVPYIETNEVRGISYRLDGKVMRGTDLGRGYTWQGLQKDWPKHTEYRQGRISYDFERDYDAISRARSREDERQNRGAGAAATEIVVGRSDNRDRAELLANAARRNRGSDNAAGGRSDELSEPTGQQTSRRQLGGDGISTRRAGDQNSRTNSDSGAGEREGGPETERPTVPGWSVSQTRKYSGATSLDLRGSSEEGGNHGEEPARGDARRNRHAAQHLGETLEAHPIELQRDNSADGLAGDTSAHVGVSAHLVDNRREQLLETLHLRNEAGGEGTFDPATPSQAAPPPATEQHQSVNPPQQLVEQAMERDRDPGKPFERLFKLMADASNLVIEREQREAAQLQLDAFSESAKELAATVAKSEQQKMSANPALDLAINDANRRVNFQLQEKIKRHGLDCLSAPETIIHLGAVVEQSLSEHGLELIDLKLTHVGLTEQLGSYLELVSKDPRSLINMEQEDSQRISINESTESPERTLEKDEYNDDFELSR
jgi:hypothetical protein